MSKLETLIQQLCPNGVEYKKIDEVAECLAGATPKTSIPAYWENGTIPWMSSGEVNNKVIYKTGAKITQKGYESCSTKMVPPNTVVVALAGQGKTRGTVAITRIELCTNQSLCSIITTSELLPDFLYHYLNGQYNKLRDISSGDGTRGGLNLKMIKNFLVPVPPLEVQREIVRILNNFAELTGKLTAELSVELTARKKQFEYYRDRLINDAIGDSGKLIDLLSEPITDGPHTTPKLVPEGVPFISAAAVWDGKIHFEKAQGFITKDFDIECAKKYKPRRNDVFMVKSGSTTGKVAFVDTDADFNVWSPLAAMRTDNEITARYIYHFLQTSSAQNMVFTRMSHGSQPNLSMRTLEQFDIKIPSFDEQRRIVAILDRFDALCNDLTSGLPAEIEARQKQYEYYRDKLLTFKPLA